MARVTLEDWIRGNMLETRHGGPLTSVSCAHKIGSADDEVWTAQIGTAQPWDPKELAGIFRQKAETRCQELPGTQTFVLLAFFNNESVARDKLPFTIAGQADFNGLTTEGPTGSGLTQQSMRHTEAMVQMGFRATQAAMEMQQKLLNELMGERRHLMGENRDALNIVKQVILEGAANDHANKMAQLNFERSTQERRALVGFIPALANSITGKEVFSSSVVDASVIETMADTMSVEDLQKLQMVVKPEIWAVLASRFEAHLKKKREEIAQRKAVKEESAKLLEGKVNPEDDVVGGPAN